MINQIPIFPLELVVFPNSKYPLHIFEERYIKMINSCLQKNIGFGIVLIKKNQFEKIGTYINISEITRKYSNNNLDIIIEGVSRFKIKDSWEHSDGYLMALIEPYEDFSKNYNYLLIEELRNKFESLIEKIDFHLDERFWNKFDMIENKSFKLAEKSGLNLEQQQHLLSLQDEDERLKFLINQLDNLEKNMDKNLSLRNIILNNGYIN
ncbi:MAG: LON peptidase substrate-binding domain-containing protein [Ignavibacterium sp.]